MRSLRLYSALVALTLAACTQVPAQAPADAHAAAEPAAAPAACAAAGFPTRYDRTIQHAATRYLPASWNAIAPCGLRAQLAAESGLNEKWCERANPHGTSAACIGQLTKAAAKDVERQAGILHSRTNPQASIRAAAFYLAAQRRVWSEPRTVGCRRTLAIATYHGGAGTLLQGQRRARARGLVARCYDDGIGDNLAVHKAENNEYIRRIAEYEARMRP